MKKKSELAGQVAVVTGGSKGIGKAIGILLAQHQCTVILLARGAEELDLTVSQIVKQGGDCHGITCDLSISSEINRVFNLIRHKFGPVSILINNAGQGSFGPFSEHAYDDLETAHLVPSMASVQASHCVIPDMIKLRHGYIVNILTPASYFPLPYMIPYTSSRWALRGFSESLYYELKDKGIHVSSVCPGLVDTDYLIHNHADFNWWPRIARIFPRVTPETTAKKAVATIVKRKRETIFPWLLWIFVKLHGLFPKTAVRLLELTRLFQPSIDHKQIPGTGSRNWEESIDLEPSTVVYPESVEEIAEIVCQPERYPSPIRTCGSRHSTTHCAVADNGTLLSTVKMSNIINIDEKNLTVTTQAGALYIDVAKALEQQGLQFYVNVEIGNLTMGSAACTGTKDASFPGEKGQVCSYLIGAKLITATGKELIIGESQPELLQAVRSSYGLFGVLHEVTFRIRPLCALNVHHKTYTLDEFERALPELKNGSESMMYYLFPFSNTLTVEFRHYSENERPYGRVAWWVRNLAWKTIAPAFSALATRYILSRKLRYGVIDSFYHVLQLILTNWITSRGSYPADQIIRYPERKGLSKYTFSIWAFPEEQISTTMKAYYKFCQDYYETTGYRCDILNVGYRIEQDTNPLFSYSWQGHVMTLDPVCSANEPGWDEFLCAYNEFCSNHNGVPLFNQTKWLTPVQVDKAFGRRLITFEEHRQRLDPDNRFLNNYFATLFAISRSSDEYRRSA